MVVVGLFAFKIKENFPIFLINKNEESIMAILLENQRTFCKEKTKQSFCARSYGNVAQCKGGFQWLIFYWFSNLLS